MAIQHSTLARPLYHFAPPANFMNDPNGLVYFDGEWHLFYQHNPFGIEWGHMSWGHAVSRDLVHWEHLPVALHEQDGMMIFSGSAAVDWRNTSGFGDGDQPPLVAAYTGHTAHEQTQHIAYSIDKGRTWKKYANNPVIAIGSRDFRDPKLFWHAPTQRWIMVVVLADQHKARFYSSTNLREWTHLSDFGPAGASDGAWECPDLFPLQVTHADEGVEGASVTALDSRPLSRINDLRGNDDEGATHEKWVLKVDDWRGIDGHSGAQYFVGDFDGMTFTCDDPLNQVHSIDYGGDFYAAQSWSDAPDNRRIWIAWMSNWAYANATPMSPWRGMMTIPREVRLKPFGAGLQLVQQPIAELQQLRHCHHPCENLSIEMANTWLVEQGIRGTALEIVAELEARDAVEFGLKVRAGAAEETLIGYDTAAQEIFVDRRRSGDNSFSPRFDDRHAAKLSLEQAQLKLHVFVDVCSVEVFVNDGHVVLSELIFPHESREGVALFAQGDVRVNSLDVWTLR